MQDFNLNICHLYPDLMNLYGDRGNIITLKKRCEWRGIETTVHKISLNDAFDSSAFDIVFIGGGQDYEQEILQKDAFEKKGALIEAIEKDTVFLCICGGYQLLGKYYRTWEGNEIKFLDILDLWTIGGKRRMIGNMLFKCDFLQNTGSGGIIAGFENHSGRTYLGSAVSPLGKVIKGYGNNGEDGFEGARYKNVFCSYSHGSLLPKNPALADFLIHSALKRKFPDYNDLPLLDDKLETLAFNSIASAISPKKNKILHYFRNRRAK